MHRCMRDNQINIKYLKILYIVRKLGDLLSAWCARLKVHFDMPFSCYEIDRHQGSCGVCDVPKVLRGGAE